MTNAKLLFGMFVGPSNSHPEKSFRHLLFARQGISISIKVQFLLVVLFYLSVKPVSLENCTYGSSAAEIIFVIMWTLEYSVAWLVTACQLRTLVCLIGADGVHTFADILASTKSRWKIRFSFDPPNLSNVKGLLVLAWVTGRDFRLLRPFISRSEF